MRFGGGAGIVPSGMAWAASHRYGGLEKWQDCNWVQAREGSIDTAHFTFAHLTSRKKRQILDIQKHFVHSDRPDECPTHMRWISGPRVGHQDQSHDAGLTIAGAGSRHRQHLLRIAQFLMPVHSYALSAMPARVCFADFIPVTDTNCWIYTDA